ncbi:MAG: hypothetical protein AAB784_02630 [Patescibacteria group bacterium]
MQKTGFFWHVHHRKLIEWCFDYTERATYIKNSKPENERTLHLRLFKPVIGSLPEEVTKAGQVYIQAKRAYDQAWQAYYDRTRQAYDPARQAYYQAKRAYNQAWQVYIQAEQVYERALKDNTQVINALHLIECLNCPWNGHTIFS